MCQVRMQINVFCTESFYWVILFTAECHANFTRSLCCVPMLVINRYFMRLLPPSRFQPHSSYHQNLIHDSWATHITELWLIKGTGRKLTTPAAPRIASCMWREKSSTWRLAQWLFLLVTGIIRNGMCMSGLMYVSVSIIHKSLNEGATADGCRVV